MSFVGFRQVYKSNANSDREVLKLEITKIMADDKSKIGKPDRNLINFKEKYEFDYALKQLQKQAPTRTKQEVKTALTDAAKEISPSEGREKIMNQARKNLKGK